MFAYFIRLLHFDFNFFFHVSVYKYIKVEKKERKSSKILKRENLSGGRILTTKNFDFGVYRFEFKR
jgi:hypothetical protein